MILTGRLPKYVEYGLCVLVGVIVGSVVLLDLPIKWKGAVVFCFILGSVLMVLNSTRRIMLFALAFLTPFYIGKDYLIKYGYVGEFRAIGIYLTDVVVVGLLGLYLARLASRKSRFNLFPATSFPALAWLATGLFSLFNAKDGLVLTIQMIAMAKGFLLYLAVANSIEDEGDFMWLLNGMMLTVSMQGMLGIYQGITKHPLGLYLVGEEEELFGYGVGSNKSVRPQGTISHPNDYAMYLTTATPFMLALLFSRVSRLHKVLVAMAFSFTIPGMLVSLSRGSWSSFLIIFITVSILAIRSRRVSPRTVFMVFCVALAILLLLTVASWGMVMSRLTSDDGGSAQSRVVLAKGAIAVIQDYPVWGVGLNNYSLVMANYDRASFLAWQSLAIVHNIFLLIAAETGLLGLAAFVSFMVSVWLKAWRVVRDASSDVAWVAGVGVFCAYMALTVHNMVDYTLLANLQLFTHFWLLSAIAVGVDGMLERSSDTLQERPSPVKVGPLTNHNPTSQEAFTNW